MIANEKTDKRSLGNHEPSSPDESNGIRIPLGVYAGETVELLTAESTIPLYHQLYRLLKRFIEQGGLSSGDRFPAEEMIASLYGVSRPTANRAVQELISKQWLVRERGRGTFVKGQQLVGLALLSDYLSLTEQFPPDASLRTTITDRKILDGPSNVVSRLGLPSDARVLYFRRLRAVDEQPVMVCDSYLPFDRFADLKNGELVGDSLYATLEERYGYVITRSERSLVAGELLDQQVADYLDVPPFSPMLSLKGLTYVQGEASPIEYMEAFVRECIEFTNTVYRKERGSQHNEQQNQRDRRQRTQARGVGRDDDSA